MQYSAQPAAPTAKWGTRERYKKIAQRNYEQGFESLRRELISNVAGQVIENGCTRMPRRLFKKDFSMIGIG